MRNLRNATMVMGALAGTSLAASMFVTGCSGDDTSDGGKDSSADTPADQTNPDVQADSPKPDAGPDGDGGVINKYQKFRDDLAAAFCTRFQNCCNGLDAGPFDYNTCASSVSKGGVEGSNIDLSVVEVLNGNNLTLDNTAAQTCLAGLATLSCPIITSMEWKSVADNCMNAVTGTLAVNGSCIRPIECQKGEYCNYLVEAGTTDGGYKYGLCANLLGQGVKCGQSAPYYVVNTTYSSEECGYKGWPKPKFCNYDTDPNKAGFFCDNPRTNGTVCYADNECASELCVDVTDAGTCNSGTCQCQNTQDFSIFCKILKIKDAGPG